MEFAELISLDAAPVEENANPSQNNFFELQSELNLSNGFLQSKSPTTLSFEPEFDLPNFENPKFSEKDSIFNQPFFVPPTVGTDSSNFPFQTPISTPNEVRSTISNEIQSQKLNKVRIPNQKEFWVPNLIPNEVRVPIPNEIQRPKPNELRIPNPYEFWAPIPISNEVRSPISIPEVENKYSVFDQLAKETQNGTAEIKGKQMFEDFTISFHYYLVI